MSAGSSQYKRIFLRLIYPGSGDQNITPQEGKLELKNGHLYWKRQIAAQKSRNDWDHLAGSIDDRLAELLDALHDPQAEAVICGRGGYGSSDLLRHLPWETLEGLNEKILIGFSDISALHAALFTKLGWQGIHGPMPDTNYWLQSDQTDLESLFNVISQSKVTCTLSVNPAIPTNKGADGWLFGGCLSVLTNLIGTPFLPKSLAGSLLFFEDIDEPPGRVLRYFNQWLDSGYFSGVHGIILGRFSIKCSRGQPADLSTRLAPELQKRSGIPTWSCEQFGHCTPNMPLKIGAVAKIQDKTLTWHHKRSLFIGS